MKMILLNYDDKVFKGKLSVVMAVDDGDLDFIVKELAYRCNEDYGKGCPVEGFDCPFGEELYMECDDITKKDWKNLFKRKIKRG